MFGDEPYGNYNRILLSRVLARSHDPKDIFINPLSWYEENDVRLHAGVRVASIDRAARTVTGASGVVEPYDHLVIATGSVPFVPPVAGLHGASRRLQAGGLRLSHPRRLRGHYLLRAERAARAAVIGGGLLGLEAARGLLEQGLEVHVRPPDAAPDGGAARLCPRARC